MRVLFLTNIPSPYRIDFFNEFGKYCDLTVLFEGLSATDRDKAWKGSNAQNFTPIFMPGIRVSSDKFLCPNVKKFLRQNWDVIIFGQYSTPTAMIAMDYLAKCHVSFLLEADGGLISNDNGIKYKIKKHYISAASGWISSGKATTEYLVHYGADSQKCYWYPFTSLKSSDLKKADSICRKGKDVIKHQIGVTESKMLLTVGRFTYDAGYGKGYDTIMRAAEKLSKDIGVYIVGDEPTEEFLNWRKEKGLSQVHFIGFKNKEDLAYYYAAADLFVLMTRADVWGLVINEAMSFGLPIITTDKCVAGLELVDENNGYIIPVDSSDKLIEKICSLCATHHLLISMGNESRKKIEKYTIEEMALAHKDIISRII